MEIFGREIDNTYLIAGAGAVGIVGLIAMRGRGESEDGAVATLQPAEGLTWGDIFEPRERGTIGVVGPGQPGPPGPPVACGRETEVCSTSADCCNTLTCRDGKCKTGGAIDTGCVGLNERCDRTRDCCGKRECRNGRCQPDKKRDRDNDGPGRGDDNDDKRCKDRGSRCDRKADCCDDLNCLPDDSGRQVCREKAREPNPGASCSGEGERCQDGSECCSGLRCKNGRCAGRLGTNPPDPPGRDGRRERDERERDRDTRPPRNAPDREREERERRDRDRNERDRRERSGDGGNVRLGDIDRGANVNVDVRGGTERSDASGGDGDKDRARDVRRRLLGDRSARQRDRRSGAAGEGVFNPSPGSTVGGFLPVPTGKVATKFAAIHQQETLREMANRLYGTGHLWPRLVHLNEDVLAPSRTGGAKSIQAGTRLRIG